MARAWGTALDRPVGARSRGRPPVLPQGQWGAQRLSRPDVMRGDLGEEGLSGQPRRWWLGCRNWGRDTS